jgi:hypothetical protein
MTPACVETAGRMAYILWMTSGLVYNHRNQLTRVPEALWLDNAVCVAPINRLTMLTDYANPAEKLIANLNGRGLRVG